MIKKRLNNLKKKFKEFEIDGYVVPKNDEFFSEYPATDRLKIISNFSGSAGYAVITNKKNYLFVDGRYTIQAKIESGKFFEIVDYSKIINSKLFKNLRLGIDPGHFTSFQIERFFGKKNRIKKINENLIDQIYKKKTISAKSFYSLNDKIVGENYLKKIKKIVNFLKKKNLDFILISAPENVAWILNIRGEDSPYSPLPNCSLIVDKKKNIFLISKKIKAKKLIRERKILNNKFIETPNFEKFIKNLKGKNFFIDNKSCSIFYENILKKNFTLVKGEDPTYLLKSKKNKTEITNMIKSHIIDGVALTKFLYWIKKINKRSLTEYQAQKKLESFRKLNSDYLFPSFNTIAGSGSNGAIVHYRAPQKKSKRINKNDIFLCDSGGQYKYGTTDVTRTICFNSPSKKIKKIFTRVLKGHIAVATSKLNNKTNGHILDLKARKYLREVNLDYAHGTGHGVGYFLNVHEGPQALSKNNKIKLSEGMVLSNEPGYYEKNKFGIRIENLVFIKKFQKKLMFENLTLAPIDKDLIESKMLTQNEKNYLLMYHLNIYSKLSKHLNKGERSWLASFI